MNCCTSFERIEHNGNPKDKHLNPRAHEPVSTVGNGVQGTGHHKEIERLCDYIGVNRPAIQSAHNICNNEEFQTTEVTE